MQAPPDGYTLLLSVRQHAINATLYDKLNFNFHPRHRACRERHSAPLVVVVNPSVPAKTVPEFIAYAKANPGKINIGIGRVWHSPHLAGELFKMMAGVDMVHVAVSRRRRQRSPISLADRCRLHFRSIAGVDRVHQSRQAARAGGDHRNALGGAAGCSDRWGIRAGLRGERLVRHRRPKNTPAEIVDKLNKEINAGLADPKIKARLADLGGTCFAARPPISASSSPTKPRSGAR